MKKDFKKEFPSLKEKVSRFYATQLDFPNDGRRKATLQSDSKILCERIKEEKRQYGNDFIHIDDIQEKCLDKQRVLDTINKEMAGGHGNNHQTKCWNDALIRIKNGLGL